jgi:hypothetical protein
MKRKINRHEPSSWVRGREKITKLLLERINELFDNVIRLRDRWETVSVTAILGDLYKHIGDCHLYGTSLQTYNQMYYYNQAHYAWFQYNMNVGKPISIQIADKIINTTGKGKYMGTNAYCLLRCLSTAMILRDKKVLDYYSNIPVEFTEKGSQDDLMLETMMFFYQVIIKGSHTKNEAEAAIMHIEKLFDWEEYKTTVYEEGYNISFVWRILFNLRQPLFEHVHVPVLRIYHAIFHQNQVQYEDAVYEALQHWHTYYSIGEYEMDGQEYDHSTEGEGFLALPIIAACAYAYDRGMKLQTVESEYLLDWMIEGRFDDFELFLN